MRFLGCRYKHDSLVIVSLLINLAHYLCAYSQETRYLQVYKWYDAWDQC